MDLDDWRSRINNLDEEILNLLNQRGQAALKIGELKRQQDLPYYAPERESQILDRLVARNPGPLRSDAVRAIWREILSASLALEHPLPVAYFGPAGTHTHAAAVRRFGSSTEFVPVRTIVDVFEEVERGRAEYGVVPVENSTEGAVNVTLDRLIDAEVLITGEVTLDISHHLVSRATDLGEIKRVCSHPQALAQCRGWLNAHLPEVPTEEISSTSAAAERAKDDPTVAGISSELAARLYGVPVLRGRIEDNAANSTRFLVIGRQPAPPTGRDKTSILFSMKNEPGVLYSILEPFASRRLNLTKIESRPTKRRPWEYVNFVDFEGHHDTEVVRAVLGEVKTRCQFLKILGSYPAA
ncbi:MAG: prephenate dehydratase [Candidatus Rokuibacteriota bacterium]|nr:MAG: prephenate dehydratase [Candidatus Rokubacteria bacterium]